MNKMPILLSLGLLLSGCKNYCPSGNKGTLQYDSTCNQSWIIRMENGSIYKPTNLSDFNITPANGMTVHLTYDVMPVPVYCNLNIRINCIDEAE